MVHGIQIIAVHGAGQKLRNLACVRDTNHGQAGQKTGNDNKRAAFTESRGAFVAERANQLETETDQNSLYYRCKHKYLPAEPADPIAALRARPAP